MSHPHEEESKTGLGIKLEDAAIKLENAANAVGSNGGQSTSKPSGKNSFTWNELRKYKVGKFFTCPNCSKIYQSDKALKAHFMSGKVWTRQFILLY